MLLSKKEKSILSQYQQGDELLYKEFKNILSKKVEVYGKEQIKEVYIFVLENTHDKFLILNFYTYFLIFICQLYRTLKP